jgi:hypothetical protein
MTLREQEQRRRRQPPRKRKQPQQSVLAATPHPNQILTFREWCALNKVSARTGRRIISGTMGPVVTQLSAKRIGISIANNAAWQASKARG